MDEGKQKFGAWLEGKRNAVGLTQGALAEEIGLPNASFVAALESGQRRIPAARLEAYADAINVRPVELAWKSVEGHDLALFNALMFNTE